MPTAISVEHGELADDCAGGEHGQDPLFALRRSYNDLEQALLESIAAVAGFSGDKKRLTGLEVTRCRAHKQ